MFSIEYKYFLQSAKDLSIRRASVNLNVNSSAVVRQIKKLEYILNTKLFVRNSRGLILTSQGSILYDFLIAQEDVILDFKDRFDIEKGKIKGSLKIGMMESIGTSLFSSVIKQYHKKYPDIKFYIHTKKPETIVDELIEQKLDLGLTFSHWLPKSIKKLYERKFPIGILTSINHPLQFKKEITIEDIKDFPLLLHTGALTYFRQTQRQLGLDTDFLDLSIVSNSLNFIKKSLLNNSKLISLSLSTIYGDPYAESLIFREIENEITKNTKVGIICRKSKVFNQSEIFFNKLLVSEFKKFGQK